MYITYHPSLLVRVNPNCGSVATLTLIPMSPLPSRLTTRPRITETRLEIAQQNRSERDRYITELNNTVKNY